VNWKKYNLDQEKFAKQIKNYNKKNIFNYIHLDKYNHVRDHLALSVSQEKNNFKILDFGGSIVSYYDLKKKINKEINYTIFNPHYLKLKKNLNKKNIKYISELKPLKTDLVYTNSVLQYFKNFGDFLNLLKRNKIEYKKCLITDILVSEKSSFSLIQHNHSVKNYVHNFKKITKDLKKNNLEIIYKSVFSKKKYQNKNFFLINLLLKKKR
jgi:putative methyltransferase (TIGR04325 family)